MWFKFKGCWWWRWWWRQCSYPHFLFLIPKLNTAFLLLLHPSLFHWLPNMPRLQASDARHEYLHLISLTCSLGFCPGSPPPLSTCICRVGRLEAVQSSSAVSPFTEVSAGLWGVGDRGKKTLWQEDVCRHDTATLHLQLPSLSHAWPRGDCPVTGSGWAGVRNPALVLNCLVLAQSFQKSPLLWAYAILYIITESVSVPYSQCIPSRKAISLSQELSLGCTCLLCISV